MTVKIGSLFAGIGGFELGLERSWGNAETIWQVEREEFCQKILQKHWPKSTIYNDVRDITKNNVEPVDVLIGGFPCQDVSLAGKQKGVNDGEKSSFWWEMWRIASEIRPRVIIMENVANIIRLGGVDVIGSLTQIGYDCEWTIISALQFGAPHLRERWFGVAYSNGHRSNQTQHRRSPRITRAQSKIYGRRSSIQNSNQTYWKQTTPPQSTICGVDDGIPNWMDRATRKEHNQRLQTLGNAIVPQCSQWVGDQILKSGLLDDLLEDK